MPEVRPKINPKNRQEEPFDRMLRRFKKECERAGIVQEVRDRQYHEKPNDTKNQRNILTWATIKGESESII